MFPSDQIWLARLLADREACYLHSGGMVIDGRGFLFVGHSEAGKSTTMELVRGALGERAEILCDDRNIVRWWPRGRAGGAPPPACPASTCTARGATATCRTSRRPACRCARSFSWSSPRATRSCRWTTRMAVWQRLLATLIRPMVTAEWWHEEMDVLERIADQVPCATMRFDRSGGIVPELEKLAAV